MILPPLIGSLLAIFDWRLALQVLAAGLLVILWGMILLGTPRGVVETGSDSETPAAGAFYRTRAFWLIGLCVALGLNVDLADQWAGGVHGLQMSLTGYLTNLRRHTVSTEQQNGTFGDFVHGIDEFHPLFREPIDNIFIVYDFVVDVQIWSDAANGFVQAFDGHVDARTKASRAGE